MLMPALADDQYHIRERDSFNYACEIIKPYGVIEEVLTWSKAEMVKEWRWQLIEPSSYARPGRYIFYFDDGKDYFAFVLKWS